MKSIKECPLLLLIIFTTIFLAGFKTGGSLQVVNLPFENVSASAIGIEEKITSEEGENLSEEEIAEGIMPEETANLPDSALSENAVMQTYELQKVENTYFKDALFIGDSRTVGLYDYEKQLGGAAFYAKVGMTIHNLLDSAIVEAENEKENITVEEALSRYQFGKIYLMVGINELGRGTAETFFEDYAKVVARIRQLQPEAIIFVEAIMRVSEEKSSEDPIFNNQNINARNEAIKILENKKDIFYLDMNEAVCDENGNLKKEYSFDGIHLKAVYYSIWEEFLKANGIVKK